MVTVMVWPLQLQLLPLLALLDMFSNRPELLVPSHTPVWLAPLVAPTPSPVVVPSLFPLPLDLPLPAPPLSAALLLVMPLIQLSLLQEAAVQFVPLLPVPPVPPPF